MIWAPKVIGIEGDWLVYEAHSFAKHNGSKLLRNFLDAVGSDAGVVRFCKRWGVLGICEHGLPRTHSCPSQGFDRDRPALRRESIAAVRLFGDALSRLLRIGAELSQGRLGSDEDWRKVEEVIHDHDPESTSASMLNPAESPVIDLRDQLVRLNKREVASGPTPQSSRDPRKRRMEFARTFVQVLTRRLVRSCLIRPRFFWNESTMSWQIDLDSEANDGNIPALLVLELMIAAPPVLLSTLPVSVQLVSVALPVL